MNLKKKWYALSAWQRMCVGILLAPIALLAVPLVLVAAPVGFLTASSMEIIEMILDKIYGDGSE